MQRETELAGSRVLALHNPPTGYDAAGKSKQGCEVSYANRGNQKNKQPRGHREKSVSSHPRGHGRDLTGRHDDIDDTVPRAGLSIKE